MMYRGMFYLNKDKLRYFIHAHYHFISRWGKDESR